MRLNEKIKEREVFRPFGPSVISSAVEEFFDLSQPSHDYSAPTEFMLECVPVRAERSEDIPAVVHRNDTTGDCTARIQVVKAFHAPRYAELVAKFGEKTGVPLLLNTSFNVSGPIVCTPDQACATFLHSGIDAMVLGPFLVDRSELQS